MARKIWLAILCLGMCAGLMASTDRVLEEKIDATGVNALSLDTSVGEVKVLGGSHGEVRVTVHLEPREKKWFSSGRKIQESIDQAELVWDTHGEKLELRVDAPYDKEYLQENWTVELPADLMVDLNMGVGKLTVRELTREIRAELGVGDAELELAGATARIDVGVGEVDITASAEDYGDVEADAGVGDVDLDVSDRAVHRESFVGSHADWRGSGTRQLVVDVGVGDVDIRLR